MVAQAWPGGRAAQGKAMTEKSGVSGVMLGGVAGAVVVVGAVLAWQLIARDPAPGTDEAPARQAAPVAAPAPAPVAPTTTKTAPVAPPEADPAAAPDANGAETIAAPQAGEAAPAEAAASTMAPPSFDTFRLGDDGIALVAGIAGAGAEVLILIEGAEAARATADAAGKFAALFSLDAAAVARAMTLRVLYADGRMAESGETLMIAPTLAAAPAEPAAGVAAADAPEAPANAAAATADAGSAATPSEAAPQAEATLASDTPSGDAATAAPEQAAQAVVQAPEMAGAGKGTAPVDRVPADQSAGTPTEDRAAPGATETAAADPAPEAPDSAAEPPSGGATGLAVADERPPQVLAVPPTPAAPETTAPVAPAVSTETAAAQPDAPSPPPGAAPAVQGGAVVAPPQPSNLLVSQERVTVLRADGGAARLSIDALRYAASGAVEVAGRGAADRTIRLYLNNVAQLETRPDPAGRWQVTLPPVEPGLYALRADEIDARGRVAARSETPFLREPPEALAAAQGRAAPRPPAPVPGDVAAQTPGSPGVQVVTVQPGFTLWRIARETYGAGIQYVKVFEANRDQIRDPDLIYPGQVFALPQPD